MKLLNLIAKGLYIFLGWYFSSEIVRDFLEELREYTGEKKKVSMKIEKTTENDSETTEN
jgi:hypothetical protein